jgi:chromosome segregation ATPase
MRNWLVRAQLGLMRAVGLRKLRRDLDAKSDAVQASVVAGLEALREESAEWRRSLAGRMERLERAAGGLQADVSGLRSDVWGQGKSDTERGETVQNSVGDLRAAVSDLRAELGRQQAKLSLERSAAVEQALGDLRAEISSLRADLAWENEVLRDRADSGVGSNDRRAPGS